jgi:hypothetical protein
LRNRTGIQRPKNLDENATSKLRQTVGATLPGGVRGGVSSANTLKTSGVQRPALGEVAVNRKVRLASIFFFGAESLIWRQELQAETQQG